MKKFILCCFLLLSTHVMYGQADTTQAKNQAVNKLVNLLHLKQRINNSADRSVKFVTDSNPAMAQYKDVMHDFFSKYMNWDTMGKNVKDLYKKNYSLNQLHDMIKFYQTKTGRKIAKIQPRLFMKMANISRKMAQEHQAELRQKIQKAMQNQ